MRNQVKAVLAAFFSNIKAVALVVTFCGALICLITGYVQTGIVISFIGAVTYSAARTKDFIIIEQTRHLAPERPAEKKY